MNSESTSSVDRCSASEIPNWTSISISELSKITESRQNLLKIPSFDEIEKFIRVKIIWFQIARIRMDMLRGEGSQTNQDCHLFIQSFVSELEFKKLTMGGFNCADEEL
jgi:hypothetical protein